MKAKHLSLTSRNYNKGILEELAELLICVFAGFALRIFFVYTGTINPDVGTWVVWSSRLAEQGFGNFYNGWSDYLPSYLYILWVLGKIRMGLINFGYDDVSEAIFFKMPAILSDLGAALIIYFLLKKYCNKKTAKLGFMIYAFNPAIFANSAMWGQIDGIQAFLTLLVLWLFLESRIYLGSLVVAYIALFKPTGIFIIPLILIYYFSYFKNKKHRDIPIKTRLLYLKKALIALTIFFASFFLLIIPFTANRFDYRFIIHRFELTMNEYPMTSINAFNYWQMIGKNWQNDLVKWNGITLAQWGLLVFSLIFFAGLLLFFIHYSKSAKRNFFNLILLAAIIYSASFDILTRAHERHFLIALPFMAILAVLNKKFLIIYIISSFVYLLNLYYVYNLITLNSRGFFSPNIIIFLSSINILILALLIIIFTKEMKKYPEAREKSSEKDLNLLDRANSK